MTPIAFDLSGGITKVCYHSESILIPGKFAYILCDSERKIDPWRYEKGELEINTYTLFKIYIENIKSPSRDSWHYSKHLD